MKGLWAATSKLQQNLSFLEKLRTFPTFVGKRTKVTICAILASTIAWIILPLTGAIFGIILILALILEAILILWALGEDLTGVKFLTIPALPVFYLGSYLALAKLLEFNPFGIFIVGTGLGISFYFLVLTQNIYNIAAGRSIGLVRAAQVSGVLFQVLIAFMAFGAVWIQGLPFWILTLSVFLISLVLFVLSIWSTNLAETINWENLKISATLSLVLAEISLALAFWPILPLIAALVLAIAFYVLLGLVQFELFGRLDRKVVAEYLLIAAVVLVLMLVTTKWGG